MRYVENSIKILTLLQQTCLFKKNTFNTTLARVHRQENYTHAETYSVDYTLIIKTNHLKSGKQVIHAQHIH
jgi:hypothetical protein